MHIKTSCTGSIPQLWTETRHHAGDENWAKTGPRKLGHWPSLLMGTHWQHLSLGDLHQRKRTKKWPPGKTAGEGIWVGCHDTLQVGGRITWYFWLTWPCPSWADSAVLCGMVPYWRWRETQRPINEWVYTCHWHRYPKTYMATSWLMCNIQHFRLCNSYPYFMICCCCLFERIVSQATVICRG